MRSTAPAATSRAAHIVGEAADGRECIDGVVELRPDLVLLDLKMPGMDGFSVLPELRRRAPEAKVVVLTTMGGRE